MTRERRDCLPPPADWQGDRVADVIERLKQLPDLTDEEVQGMILGCESKPPADRKRAQTRAAVVGALEWGALGFLLGAAFMATWLAHGGP